VLVLFVFDPLPMQKSNAEECTYNADDHTCNIENSLASWHIRSMNSCQSDSQETAVYAVAVEWSTMETLRSRIVLRFLFAGYTPSTKKWRSFTDRMKRRNGSRRCATTCRTTFLPRRSCHCPYPVGKNSEARNCRQRFRVLCRHRMRSGNECLRRLVHRQVLRGLRQSS
jgi:hypothetical protein